MTIADDLAVPFDRADLAEVLGNLLENAARYAKSQFVLLLTDRPIGR